MDNIMDMDLHGPWTGADDRLVVLHTRAIYVDSNDVDMSIRSNHCYFRLSLLILSSVAVAVVVLEAASAASASTTPPPVMVRNCNTIRNNYCVQAIIRQAGARSREYHRPVLRTPFSFRRRRVSTSAFLPSTRKESFICPYENNPLLLFCGSGDRRGGGNSYSNTRMFNSKDGSSMPLPTENEEEEDLLKWEKMYYAPVMQQSNSIDGSNNDIGFATTTTIAATATSTTTILDSSSSEIRVITFDLDNTIWKTSETISDANDALAAHLLHEYDIVERSEKRMGQLFRQYPERYAGVDYVPSMIDDVKDSGDNAGTGDIVTNVGQTERQVVRTTKSENNDSDGVHIPSAFGVDNKTKMKPVYLTLLRKDAIRSLLLAKDDNSSTNNLPTTTSVVELEQQIDSAFDVWMEARCQSISKNFVPCAVSTLQQLRSQQLLPSDAITTATTTTTSTKIYIGAITDGNSNPNQVPELSGLFDFVVRAEDVGVSKPDARVYKAAVASLMTRLVQDGQNIEQFFLGEMVDDEVRGPPPMYVKSDASSQVLTWKDIDEDAVDAFSDGVGPWWVHVGDDFFKDVVAAKEFQMRTVWSRELIGGNEKVSTDRTDGSSNSNISNNNNNTNLINGNSIESRQRSVSDLVNDIAKSEDGVLKMSIGASEFLSQTIHTEFSDAILDRFGDLGDLLRKWHSEGSTQLQANNEIVETLISEEISAIEGSTGRLEPVKDLPGREPSDPKNKFCISCGGQLPIIAKFCSHCGEKQ